MGSLDGRKAADHRVNEILVRPSAEKR